MDNTRKLWLTRLALASKILFHIALFIAVLFFASIVKEYQKWNDHSNKTINEIEIAQNQFRTADYTGRNRNVSGLGHQAEIDSLRNEALSSIENLKTVVSDNPKQVDNLSRLTELAKGNFASQDEQFQTIIRGENTLTYPLNSVTKRTFYMESVESLFAEIKMTELNILRLERSPKIFQSQWTTIYVLLLMIGLSFIVTVYLNIMLQRNLAASLFVGGWIQTFKDKKEDKNYIQVPTDIAERWVQKLEGTNQEG